MKCSCRAEAKKNPLQPPWPVLATCPASASGGWTTVCQDLQLRWQNWVQSTLISCPLLRCYCSGRKWQVEGFQWLQGFQLCVINTFASIQNSCRQFTFNAWTSLLAWIEFVPVYAAARFWGDNCTTVSVCSYVGTELLHSSHAQGGLEYEDRPFSLKYGYMISLFLQSPWVVHSSKREAWEGDEQLCWLAWIDWSRSALALDYGLDFIGTEKTARWEAALREGLRRAGASSARNGTPPQPVSSRN